MNIRKNIHKNLRKKGITAYKLSKDTKISQGYIYDILSGKEHAVENYIAFLNHQ